VKQIDALKLLTVMVFLESVFQTIVRLTKIHVSHILNAIHRPSNANMFLVKMEPQTAMLQTSATKIKSVLYVWKVIVNPMNSVKLPLEYANQHVLTIVDVNSTKSVQKY
jgi:hypothetical protein